MCPGGGTGIRAWLRTMFPQGIGGSSPLLGTKNILIIIVMEDLKKYLEYYFLENYLLNDVKKNFWKRGYLTPKEFFAIIIWKSNRSKTRVRKGIEKNGKTIRQITTELFLAKTHERKLEILCSITNIGISIASAVLTVCYPNDFTVVDYRARTSLKSLGIKIKGDPTINFQAYFDYLKSCKTLSKKYELSLRDFDRALWAKDFYEGANGLNKFIKGLR